MGSDNRFKSTVPLAAVRQVGLYIYIYIFIYIYT